MEHLIREQADKLISCTIVDLIEDKLVLSNKPFRDAVAPYCAILFYTFKKNIYYPISMEFRLIDNNILFLIDELKIKKFSLMAEVLKSSFKREEGLDVEFFPILCNLNKKPKYCIEISDFLIDSPNTKKINLSI